MSKALALFLLALICLAAFAKAQDAAQTEDIIISEEGDETDITLNNPELEYLAPKPEGSFVFLENFNTDPLSEDSKWVSSKNPKYNGIWKWSGPVSVQGVPGDKGLLVSEPARHYAIAAPIKPALDSDNKDLVVQYEVKFDKRLECGGAYIKLLADEGLTVEEFDDQTPYIIMFGPDKCGSNEKVHFIFRHFNPKSGEWQEKHMTGAPTFPNDQLTHLYTLVVRKDNSFDILIDNEVVKSGNLLQDFSPPVIPPQEIDDPEDKKPADWVDNETMPDPAAVKPEDWDEDAPKEIDDPEDFKPEGWLDNEPLEIPDPNAEKPADWDDEEDGEWEAPLVPNPKCDEFGCGEWRPRRIANPAYKGPWSAPMIPNPDFKGHWAPRKIPNPNYFEDKHPHNFPKIGALAIEIWTMQENILFDNFLITHDINVAKQYADKTWKIKNEKDKILAPPPSKPSELMKTLNNVKDKAMQLAQHYPIPVFATIGALVLAVPLLCLLGGKSASPPAESADTDAPQATESEPIAEASATTTESTSPSSKLSKRKSRKET